MSRLEIVRALYEYNEWADNHILDAASELPEADFSRQQGVSFGSVEANLAHINGAQAVWLHRWKTGAEPPDLDGLETLRGYVQIRRAFGQSHTALREFVDSLTDEDLGGVLHFTDYRGAARKGVLWKMLVHVANHGTHHRAETAMALTAMGHPPATQLDYGYFEQARNPG